MLYTVKPFPSRGVGQAEARLARDGARRVLHGATGILRRRAFVTSADDPRVFGRED